MLVRKLRTYGAATVALAVAFGTVVAAQGPAVASGPAAGASSVLPAGKSWTVTLITGDIVAVRTVAGDPPLVTIKPGAGRTGVAFSEYVDTNGHVRVLPGDVAPLLGKVLDPTLFDVTTLILDGDADASRSSLPLIVRGGNGATGHAVAQNLGAALLPGVDLSSIDAEAVTEPKAHAADLGGKLAAMATASLHTGRLTPAVTGNLSYIWLDRTVHTMNDGTSAGADPSGTGTDKSAGTSTAAGPLDHNLTQIKAPAAWAKGDTGQGVTVAVLDTGIDATFPDLAGRITGEQNFSSSPDMVDRFGHGTFVATQIAGSGAAADGERRGVAYDSRLIIGKVLGDDGSGDDASVIAGMQWAAPQAKVISMSLGDYSPSDGTDPLSAALDELSISYGVLFVVAAGNSGPGEQTVSAPGAATTALTVGAVDGTDALAPFSSRGPRTGDYAIKPEIVAPGVQIAGARAAGTSMGTILNAHYVLDSGTSMATPQVAGAAAILSQLHPDWSAAQIKADLVATAHAATGGDAYDLGGGRLDIADAISATTTFDQAVADLGSPVTQATTPVTDPLVLTDVGTHAETVNVSADLTDRAGNAAPAGTIGVSAETVHINAGGNVKLLLNLHPGLIADHPGLYEGRVTVRNGNQTVHIPISLLITPPMHQLTVNATALPGTPAGDSYAYATVLDVDDPALFTGYVNLGSATSTTIEVPDGHYWVTGEVDDMSNPQAMRSALVGQPDVLVGGDTTVTLDAASAVPVSGSVTGRATEIDDADVLAERGSGGWIADNEVYSFATTATPLLYAQPTDAPRTGTFKVSTGFRLIDPTSPAAYAYNVFHSVGNRVPGSLTYQITPAVQANMARVDESFYALDGNTTPYMEQVYGLTDSGFLGLEFSSTVNGGTTRTDYFSTEPGVGWNQEAAPPVTIDGVTQSGPWVSEIPGFTHYVPGSRTSQDWAREVFRPGPYSATKLSTSFCAPQASTRAAGNIHVELVDLQDLPDGYDCLQNMGLTTQSMQLFLGDKSLGTVPSGVADFAVPAGSGTYRLVYNESTSIIPVSTSTSTTWTFVSAAPVGTNLVRLPLLTVDYSLPLGLDDHPDGQTATFTVTRVAGSGSATVTGLQLWTSTDGGTTWTAAPVHCLGAGRYAATLPKVAAGQAVSLRVQAGDAGGSTIDQTIITAYHG